LQLEAADAHLAYNRPERARAIVQQTMERARLTLADARKAIGDLRQGWTEAGDLRSGLSQEVERFTQATGIPCELQLNPADEIPHKLFEPVLRAISEGLTNIARHAQAHQAHVTLCAAGGWLEVEIWDDGCGFDPQAGVGKSGHYGLLGMRERARLVEGTLEIESQPGSGTTLRLKLPLNGENNA
jgi:NarL family two-component system sensor histidine kinase YdfH